MNTCRAGRSLHLLHQVVVEIVAALDVKRLVYLLARRLRRLALPLRFLRRSLLQQQKKHTRCLNYVLKM